MAMGWGEGDKEQGAGVSWCRLGDQDGVPRRTQQRTNNCLPVRRRAADMCWLNMDSSSHFSGTLLLIHPNRHRGYRGKVQQLQPLRLSLYYSQCAV